MARKRHRIAHIMPWEGVGGTEQAALRIARTVEDAGFDTVDLAEVAAKAAALVEKGHPEARGAIRLESSGAALAAELGGGVRSCDNKEMGSLATPWGNGTASCAQVIVRAVMIAEI